MVTYQLGFQSVDADGKQTTSWSKPQKSVSDLGKQGQKYLDSLLDKLNGDDVAIHVFLRRTKTADK